MLKADSITYSFTFNSKSMKTDSVADFENINKANCKDIRMALTEAVLVTFFSLL